MPVPDPIATTWEYSFLFTIPVEQMYIRIELPFSEQLSLYHSEDTGCSLTGAIWAHDFYLKMLVRILLGNSIPDLLCPWPGIIDFQVEIDLTGVWIWCYRKRMPESVNFWCSQKSFRSILFRVRIVVRIADFVIQIWIVDKNMISLLTILAWLKHEQSWSSQLHQSHTRSSSAFHGDEWFYLRMEPLIDVQHGIITTIVQERRREPLYVLTPSLLAFPMRTVEGVYYGNEVQCRDEGMEKVESFIGYRSVT